MEFRVLPELQHSAILGMVWLTKVNPEIDWVDHVVGVRQSNGTVV